MTKQHESTTIYNNNIVLSGCIFYRYCINNNTQTTTTNATRLRVINKIDNNREKESVLSPDLITPML